MFKRRSGTAVDTTTRCWQTVSAVGQMIFLVEGPSRGPRIGTSARYAAVRLLQRQLASTESRDRAPDFGTAGHNTHGTGTRSAQGPGTTPPCAGCSRGTGTTSGVRSEEHTS